ncbi:hypothetical protein SAMN05428989_2042 [Pseudoxanthomonas sp. GM95]|uniref:hypothetical protein n=1 Tax=Pseudoxanthomonas sp. GM95 TaxID=1881043 RepID=UPI0008BB37AB|nr:hypothetical protein [Pseudoxanthomonas sp. GM95]SEL60444.1 hypothetical protein SAMN05428989_2042 [Pseudoxanthomonas sp. GM95]
MTIALDLPRQVPPWLDLETEHQHWMHHFQKLPCARKGDTIDECWPLIETVYGLYIKHPQATLDQALALYGQATAGLERQLTHEDMREMFARVWARLLKVSAGRSLPHWLPGLADAV